MIIFRAVPKDIPSAGQSPSCQYKYNNWTDLDTTSTQHLSKLDNLISSSWRIIGGRIRDTRRRRRGIIPGKRKVFCNLVTECLNGGIHLISERNWCPVCCRWKHRVVREMLDFYGGYKGRGRECRRRSWNNTRGMHTYNARGEQPTAKWLSLAFTGRRISDSVKSYLGVRETVSLRGASSKRQSVARQRDEGDTLHPPRHNITVNKSRVARRRHPATVCLHLLHRTRYIKSNRREESCPAGPWPGASTQRAPSVW